MTYIQLLLFPCKEWDGSRLPTGYGYRNVDGRRWYLHRLTWTQEVGQIPPGMHVLHHCDNPPCYEITHLFLGTRAINMQDCVSKGRHALQQKGQNHPAAKLTDVQYAEIRARRTHGKGKSNVKQLAEEFGISERMVCKITQNDNSRGTRILSEEDVRSIRERAIPRVPRGHPGNYRDLAEEFDVTYGYIKALMMGRHR